MGNFKTYLLVMTGIILMCHLTGLIPTNTPNSILLQFVLHPNQLLPSQDNPSMLPLAVAILAGIAVLAGAGIVVGIFGGQLSDTAALTGLALYLFVIGWDFIVVYNLVYNESKLLATVFIAPIFLMYIFTTIEFWRGRD